MDGETFRWIVSGLLAVLVAVFSSILRRLFGKVDALDERKANANSTEKRFEDMGKRLELHMAEDREMHRDVLQELRETNRHLSMTNTTLANLAGRFDAQNGHH